MRLNYGLRTRITYKGKLYQGVKAYARAWAQDNPKATREDFLKELDKYNVNPGVAYQYYYSIFSEKVRLKRQLKKNQNKILDLVPTLNAITNELFICNKCLNFSLCKNEKYQLTFKNDTLYYSIGCELFECLSEG